jgi:hypothetical protein
MQTIDVTKPVISIQTIDHSPEKVQLHKQV